MIETLAHRLANFLPQYGATLWGVLRAPVIWTVTRAPRDGEAWPAVSFWAASLALYTLTRFLMFERLADPFAYIAAVFLSNGLHLILTALSLALLWRLFRAPLAVQTTLSASAYCWGAVIPIQTVLVILMFGLLRGLDEQLYTVLANMLNGCRDAPTPEVIRRLVGNLIERSGAIGLWALATYGALFLILTGVFLGYAIAMLRGLRRLSGVSLASFLILAVLAALLWAFAGVISSGVYLMLLSEASACLPFSQD